MPATAKTPALEPNALFCGGAHLDRLGKVHGEALAGRSNPGHFVERAGGAALNSASVFAGLGGTASLAAMLADDDAGRAVIQAARQRGIALAAQSAKSTATYTAILDKGGDLVVALADMAAYDQFDTSKIAPPEEADWLFVDANLPPEALDQLCSNAPCPVAASTVSVAKAGRLIAIAPALDVLFSNRVEALTLGGINTDGSMEAACNALTSVGIKTAIISDSGNPVYLLENGGISHIPVTVDTTLVDVTGAGDALAGACLYSLAYGTHLRDAAVFGIRAAQAVLAVEGPWRSDLAAILDSERNDG